MGSNDKVFIWNHLVHVGKYAYTSTQNGKYFNIVEQLLDGMTGVCWLVVLDNAFLTISLLRTAKTDWNTVIAATQAGNMKHLPEKHVSFQYIIIFTQVINIKSTWYKQYTKVETLLNKEPITDMIFLWRSPSVVFSKLVNNKDINDISITSLNDLKVIFGETSSVSHIW